MDELEPIQTAETFLAKLRKGQNQDRPLEIGIGDQKLRVRLISAAEELKIVVNAETRAESESLTGRKLEVTKSYAVMIAMLYAATTIDGKQQIPVGGLERLPAKWLSSLFEQFTELNDVINPNLQELTLEELGSIVEGVKKKTLFTSDLFSYQLRGVGKYFLDVIVPNLPTANDSGLP